MRFHILKDLPVVFRRYHKITSNRLPQNIAISDGEGNNAFVLFMKNDSLIVPIYDHEKSELIDVSIINDSEVVNCIKVLKEVTETTSVAIIRKKWQEFQSWPNDLSDIEGELLNEIEMDNLEFSDYCESNKLFNQDVLGKLIKSNLENPKISYDESAIRSILMNGTSREIRKAIKLASAINIDIEECIIRVYNRYAGKRDNVCLINDVYNYIEKKPNIKYMEILSDGARRGENQLYAITYGYTYYYYLLIYNVMKLSDVIEMIGKDDGSYDIGILMALLKWKDNNLDKIRSEIVNIVNKVRSSKNFNRTTENLINDLSQIPSPDGEG